ncbi:MAG: flagellar motor protein [Betaproteobacteria bacterium]|nr:flagellar motor protein [Betaproteobacteria bacterium]
MDLNSVLGIALALLGIVGGQLLEGARFGSLLQLAALLIVLGGTAGAVMLQSSRRVFVEGLKLSKWVFLPPRHAPERLLRELAAWGAVARREGPLRLERYAESAGDALARRGLQLVADGAEPQLLRDALELEIARLEERRREAARIWEAAGGYAPTIGILGAVLGLIHVMENLTDPSRLGDGIAVAFVATVYGVGLANLVFLPIANKLKALIAQQALGGEILVDGLEAIARGEGPRAIEIRLEGYLPGGRSGSGRS